MNVWKVAAAAALVACTMPALAAAKWTGTASAPVMQNSWAATATQAVPAGFLDVGRTNFLMGRMPESQPMRIVVGLSLRDRLGAANLLHHQYTKGDALFHRFVTPYQYTSMFAPTNAQANAVAAYLAREGFTNISIEPNNLLVSATASASRVEAAFGTTIRATVQNGRLLYANVTPALVPTQLHGLVIAVLGLNNVYQMKPHIKITRRFQTPLTQVTAANTPPPCTLVTPQGVCIGGIYGPKQYQTAYDACSVACAGGNTSVAVMAEGNVAQVLPDLRYAESYWGLPQVPFTVKKVGVSSIDTSGLDEWDLDTQSSTGIAQKVKHLYLYDTTSLTDSDIALEFSHWVTDDLAQAGNASFGEPETLAYADGSMLVDDEEFNQAASQGQTMFASTSDSGEGCSTLVATGVPFSGTPVPCYPAVSPYVVAVGGTTLDTNSPGYTYNGEHAWIATGGGFSSFETAPYWQTNGIVPGAPVLATGLAGRGIADISMCSDNNGCPMYVFVDEPASEEVGGTSLGSPLSMGVWARMETHYNNALGFAAPVYYGVYAEYEPCPLGSSACVPAIFEATIPPPAPPDGTELIGGFHDVLYGTNGAPVLPGWDPPTGLGSIDICAMQAAIKNSLFSGH